MASVNSSSGDSQNYTAANDTASVTLSDTQKTLLRTDVTQPFDICLLQGAWASGKTHASCFNAIYLASKNPNNTGLILTKRAATLKQTIWPILETLLHAGHFHRGRDYWYNQKDRVLRFANGSRIYLKSFTSRYQDIQANWVWVDNALDLAEAQFDQLLQQLTRPGQKRLWLTCRPFAMETSPDAVVVPSSPTASAVSSRGEGAFVGEVTSPTNAGEVTPNTDVHWLNNYFGMAAPDGLPCRRLVWHTRANPLMQDPASYAHLAWNRTAEQLDALLSGVHPTEVAWQAAQPPWQEPELPDGYTAMPRRLLRWWQARHVTSWRSCRMRVSNGGGGWLRVSARAAPAYERYFAIPLSTPEPDWPIEYLQLRKNSLNLTKPPSQTHGV
jgi:hypothetical protein